MSGIKKIYNFISRRSIPAKHLILLYHHIDNTGTDPWEMFVSPENFKNHLEVLSAGYHVASLSNNVFNKQNTPTIYLSFDDGYLDNYTNAYPLLKQYHLPATFFIASKIFEQNPWYWWEIVEKIFLQDYPLPPSLKLRINDQDYLWEINTNKSADSRQKIYNHLCLLLKTCLPLDQQNIIHQLLNWSGVAMQQNDFSKLTIEQIQQLHQEGLIKIGAHTTSHPALGYLSPNEQWKQITDNKKILTQILSAEINEFAYPHGHYDDTTVKLVKKAGFRIAVTTEENHFTRYTAPARVPRIWVKNWQKDMFAQQLKKWLS